MTGTATIDPNGTLLNSTNLENITIYPNEYLTVTQAEYTKYYYAGGNRIASKIGTGGFGKMQQLCTLEQSLTANANTLFDNILQQAVNTTNQPTDEYPVTVCGGYNIATELLTSALPDFYISNTALNFTQNNLLQQFRQNLAGGTEAVYYFHSDHLGSASWITNNTGLPVQHLLYLPFGEYFANEHSSGYDERFTFTGKERDAETGYYYHGARFNSSDIGWLSVDPMADKYPSLSSYAYCAWNPVKLVDENGESPRLPYPIRVLTSKHVYQAIKYKLKHGGDLKIWEHSSGCIFAAVQSNKTIVDESGAIVIKTKMFRPEGYTSEAQIKATTDVFVTAETWMDEPATSVGDFVLKFSASMGYSVLNEPVKLLTGCSLAGTEATANELSEAFVGTTAGNLGYTLSKGMGTIKTVGKTGLGKYNDFVHKMGGYQGKTKKDMGILYQNNKDLNNAVRTYNNFEDCLNGASKLRDEN